MTANDAVEVRAMEPSLQSVLEDEYACSFVEAHRQAYEELNTARAVAHNRLVED